ncbi:hypothetical protein [Halomarina rubra]|uniref:Uncharacterized protein n=1 Tax=Halomarina rubra TaxID=2071873 RepID=A0ABD6AZG7_9EURY|nr:hypothetical protein [Halomarina rubra]
MSDADGTVAGEKPANPSADAGYFPAPPVLDTMSQNDSLPDGWTERDHDPQVVDKYDPRQPSLYEHEDGTHVQAVPDAGNQATSGEDRWRVDVVDGDPKAPDETRTLGLRTGQGDALDFAREAMAAYAENGSFDAVAEETER